MPLLAVLQGRALKQIYMRFTHAIVRQPGVNFADGITGAQLGQPDYRRALAQHEAYCQALMSAGLQLSILEADERYPDGCFVEDTAVVCPTLAIITRPGNAARQGEEGAIARALAAHKNLIYVQPPGLLDGGDVLQVHEHFFIGLSKRTNEVGAQQLASWLASQGYTSSTVPVSGVLHLKTGVTYLGQDHYIGLPAFEGLIPHASFIPVETEESYCANCLAINDHLLMPAGFPGVKARLQELPYTLLEVDMSEFEKMDGGLSCLSLLF